MLMGLHTQLQLEPTADFHVHLRDGKLMELVVPTIRQGGVDTVYVMPNLQPPITTVEAALSYKQRLQNLAPDVTFLMTLYLHPSITPVTIAEAARAGIAGVKYYPAGVTTNSQHGVLDITQFYPVFEAMQDHGLVLNLHGEVPSTPSSVFAESDGIDAVTILNAEPRFLPTLQTLHSKFPKLRIVLEHVSTRDGLAAVRACGPTVAGTITAHHLWMTIDQWSGDAFSFCKPVAKTPADQVALVRAMLDQESGKFFFGSDSAPHPLEAKKGSIKNTAAGCFTQGWATQLVVQAVELGLQNGWVRDDQVAKQVLQDFLSTRGRKFYGLPAEGTSARQSIVLENKGEKIPQSIKNSDGSVEVVPFRRNEPTWSLSWQ